MTSKRKSELDVHVEARRDPYGSRLHRSVREVHRDDVLWVLDKPAGVLSHPNPPTVRASNAILRADYDHADESYVLEREGPRETRVWLVHRLDLDTSGLLLCAFTVEAAASLQEDLFHRDLQKEYRALLLAAPTPPIGQWDDRIARTTVDGRVEVRVKSGAKKNASTSYELLRTFPGNGLALVTLRPHTGRTHQLRVQTAKRGIPIAGDERYGDFVANRFLRDQIGLRHMFLHAYRITLRHPRSGHRMTFCQEPSQRLTAPLEALERLERRVPRTKAAGNEEREKKRRGPRAESGSRASHPGARKPTAAPSQGSRGGKGRGKHKRGRSRPS